MSKLKLSSNASGSGNVTLESPNTNSDFTVTVPSGTGALPLMKLETAVASTSGTSIDFTGIPSWVKRITVMLSGVSLSGTEELLIRVGTGSTPATTGYNSAAVSVSVSSSNTTNGSASNTTNGFTGAGYSSTAAATASGQFVLTNISGNSWVGSGVIYSIGNLRVVTLGGDVTLEGALNMVRITNTGADTFDAGTINILYEG